MNNIEKEDLFWFLSFKPHPLINFKKTGDTYEKPTIIVLAPSKKLVEYNHETKTLKYL